MKTKTLGEKIKQERGKKKLSLRKFAETLGISAAYQVDIEKDRRQPNEELLQKAADLLDIPISEFDEFMPSLPRPVKEWIGKNPLIGKVIELLNRASSPEDTIKQFERSLSKSTVRKYPIAIYESELQSIGLDSASWETETGGDLFGIWGDIPVVYFASKAGPKAQRDHAHFRLDIEYLIHLSIVLEKDWGLRYFGDWHSHHSLGLNSPSNGDKKRIVSVADKNHFDEMAEFIITFDTSGIDMKRKIKINPYLYLDLPSSRLTDAIVIVVKGISPVRSALLAASSLPEQQLDSYGSFPIENLSIPREPIGRVSGADGNSVAQFSERLVNKIATELATISHGNIEIYHKSFGYVLVVPVNDKEYVAFAHDKTWPHYMLQADWINRRNGSITEIDINTDGISLLNLSEIKKMFVDIKNIRAEIEK